MMESEYATPHSPSPVERGHLVLADISGYSAFLSQTELEHAQENLTDLLKTILQRVKTLLTIERKRTRGLHLRPQRRCIHYPWRDPAGTPGGDLHGLSRTHEECAPSFHLHLPRLRIHTDSRPQVHGASRRICRAAHRRQARVGRIRRWPGPPPVQEPCQRKDRLARLHAVHPGCDGVYGPAAGGLG